MTFNCCSLHCVFILFGRVGNEPCTKVISRNGEEFIENIPKSRWNLQYSNASHYFVDFFDKYFFFIFIFDLFLLLFFIFFFVLRSSILCLLFFFSVSFFHIFCTFQSDLFLIFHNLFFAFFLHNFFQLFFFYFFISL